MTLRECVLRAYNFHVGRANNEQVSAYVADRRPETRERLHERLIPREVQALKNQGLLVNVVRSQTDEPGIWRLTPAGKKAAQCLIGSD